MKQQTKKKIPAVIDRFEGNMAVILVGEDEKEVVFPAEELPDGLNEGDYMKITFEYDENATKSALLEADELMKRIMEANE